MPYPSKRATMKPAGSDPHGERAGSTVSMLKTPKALEKLEFCATQ